MLFNGVFPRYASLPSWFITVMSISASIKQMWILKLSGHQRKEARGEQISFEYEIIKFKLIVIFLTMECMHEAEMNFHNFWAVLLLQDKIPAATPTNFSGLWSEEMTSEANWFLLVYWE